MTNLIEMGRRKSSEERCREIIKVGLTILHEEGKSKLTVGNIADRIGVSEAAVYKHFDSKQEIVEGMAKEAFTTEFIKLDDLNFNQPVQLLQAILSNLFSQLEQNPEMTAILFHDEIFSDYPEVRQLFQEHRSQKKAKLEILVEKGQTSGAFSQEFDPETFATIVIGSIRFTVMEWRQKGFAYSLTEKTAGLAQQLATILKPE